VRAGPFFTVSGAILLTTLAKTISVAKKSQDARGHEEHMTEHHQRVSHDLRRNHPNIQSLSCS
jgi:hypothetical protein